MGAIGLAATVPPGAPDPSGAAGRPFTRDHGAMNSTWAGTFTNLFVNPCRHLTAHGVNERDCAGATADDGRGDVSCFLIGHGAAGGAAGGAGQIILSLRNEDARSGPARCWRSRPLQRRRPLGPCTMGCGVTPIQSGGAGLFERHVRNLRWTVLNIGARLSQPKNTMRIRTRKFSGGWRGRSSATAARLRLRDPAT